MCKPKGKYSIKTNVIKNQSNLKTADNDKHSQFSKVVNKNRIKEQAIQIKVKKDEEKKISVVLECISSNLKRFYINNIVKV